MVHTRYVAGLALSNEPTVQPPLHVRSNFGAGHSADDAAAFDKLGTIRLSPCQRFLYSSCCVCARTVNTTGEVLNLRKRRTQQWQASF